MSTENLAKIVRLYILPLLQQTTTTKGGSSTSQVEDFKLSSHLQQTLESLR